jgi:hypothetical protein
MTFQESVKRGSGTLMRYLDIQTAAIGETQFRFDATFRNRKTKPSLLINTRTLLTLYTLFR